MPVVKQRVPHLLGGVSEAPDFQRPPWQLREMDNAIPSPTKGLHKRPPMVPVGSVSTSSTVAIHNVRYDDGAAYKMVFTTSGIQVYNSVTGNPAPVSGNTGYLSGATQIRTLQVGEDTYVLNTDKPVMMHTAGVGNTVEWVLVWIREAVPGQDYTIKADGTDYTVTLPEYAEDSGAEKHISTSWAASVLHLMLHNAGFTVQRQGSVLAISTVKTRPIPRIVEIHTVDSGGDELMVRFGRTLVTAEVLPPWAPEGYVVEITGNPDTNSDNYYLGYSNGRWRETDVTGGTINYRLDPSTTPHILRRIGSSFSFIPIDWPPRRAGDAETNPNPAIAGITMGSGKTIDDIFFYEGRFGMVAGSHIFMTGVGDFRTYRKSARELLDSDPIDIQAAIGGAVFHSALEWNEKLYLFTSTGQYVLSGSPMLTPTTVRLDRVSDHPSSSRFRPAIAGDRLFLARALRSGTTQVLHMADPRDRTSYADDVTTHIPGYIKGAPRGVAADATLGFLAVLTTTPLNVIYVYFYGLNPDGSRGLSSWGRWVLPVNISAIDMEDGVLSVVTSTGTLATINVRDHTTHQKSGYMDLGSTPVSFKATLGGIYMRDERGHAETRGRLTVHKLDVLHGPSTDFSVTVSLPHRSPTVSTFSTSSPVAGAHRVTVRGQGPLANITITDNSPGYVSLEGIDWEGFYTDRGERV